MSKCISMHGEYSDCAPDQNFICKRCTALDEDALFAKVEQLTDEVERLNAELAATRSNFRALIDLHEDNARRLEDES